MKALLVVTDGFDAHETLYVAERLREEDLEVDIAAEEDEAIDSEGDTVAAVSEIRGVEAREYEVVHISSGDRAECEREGAAGVVRDAASEGAFVTAAGKGVLILADAGEVEYRQVAATGEVAEAVEDAGGRAYDEPVIVDGRFVTTLGGDNLPAFGAEVVRKVRRARVKDL